MPRVKGNPVKKIIAYIPEEMWGEFEKFLESEYGRTDGKLAHGAVSLGLRRALGVFLESIKEE